MEQRIEDSPEGMIADYFRTKGADGNFTWDVHTIISIPKTNGKVFLYTAKLSPLDDETSANTSSRNTSKTTNQN